MSDLPVRWYKVLDKSEFINIGTVRTVIAGHEQICLSRTEEGWGAICDSCPHQGGPLGEGYLDTLEDGKQYVICPWHGYEYHWKEGKAPGGYDDTAAPFLVEEREDGIYVAVPEEEHQLTKMDTFAATLVKNGVNSVFGMVGHSNLGLADAFYNQEQQGNLTYIGVRHEGAAAFAASGYAKLTNRPAVCFSIAGPGATNLYTGLWDAKVDRVPIIAITGQVDTKFLGPHNFQEIPTEAAFKEVAAWSQTIHSTSNPEELAVLAIKNAIINRDVSHLVIPDEVQTELAQISLENLPSISGRVANSKIKPDPEICAQAVKKLENAKFPIIIIGNGAREYSREIVAFADKIDAPILTTFKAKGAIPESHRLATGVLGRSGTPVSASVMGKSDVILVLGATFSKHTGISEKKTLIQVDYDRMNLGKFHPVDVPIWGEIGITLSLLGNQLAKKSRPKMVEFVKIRWEHWRAIKAERTQQRDAQGRLMNAMIFSELSKHVPNDAIIAVDVGNNTYSFGRYFESKQHALLMSGYLGSIGFALPAAIGASVAHPDQKIVAICGDGGFGQYAMEFTTLVKYNMNVTVILLNNSELAKITKEQKSAGTHVFATSLVNPNFAEFARNCGGLGIRVETADELSSAFQQTFTHIGPSLVEIISTSDPF